MTAPLPAPRRRSPLRTVIIVAVALLVAMWVYVLVLAIRGREDPPDRLEDRTFPAAAQARCDEALYAVDALPKAAETSSAAERADVIDQANAIFAEMLDDLEAMAPAGEEGEIVAAWLADWRAYLKDRAEFAERLREDPTAQLLVTARLGEQVTEYMDVFAADNDMPACATPIDV